MKDNRETMFRLMGLKPKPLNENMDMSTEVTSSKESDYISGGLADDKSSIDFNPEQILKGMEVEMEHTNDPRIALEITMDHLTENPEYYTFLDKMETEMESNTDNTEQNY